MRFKHKYGGVELALEGEDDVVYARYVAPVRQTSTTTSFAKREDGEFQVFVRRERPMSSAERRLTGYRSPDDVVAEWKTWPGEDITLGEALEDAILTNPEQFAGAPLDRLRVDPNILEAAYTLLMDDYAGWQKAELLMGDPYP